MKCPNCNQQVGAPDWKARQHIRWRNQWGQKVRIFCDACGAWHDITQKNSRPDVIVQVRAPGDVIVPTPYGGMWKRTKTDKEDYQG